MSVRTVAPVRATTTGLELEFRLLGPPEIRGAHGRYWFRGHRQRAVFAALTLNANRIVGVERLIDVVWPDDPPSTAQVQIHKAISSLRMMLTESNPTARISTVFPGYVLHAGAGEVDVERFECEVGLGSTALSSGRLVEAGAHLRSALGRWYGRALDGVPGLVAEAAYLEERRLSVLENCISTDLALGGHARSAATLARLVADHPLRERLHALHMVALYRDGRRADALAAYQAARRVLRQELGLEPGAELRRLERAILDGTPAEQLARGSR